MSFLAGYVTPQDYGAVGNGVTDDTAAFNSAISAVNTAGGGTLFIPPATYAVTPVSSTSAAITFNNGSTGYNGVRLVGSGEGAVHIKKLANGPIFAISGPSTDTSGATHCKYCSLENLYLDGNRLTGTMVQSYYADDILVQNVHFVNNADVVWDTAEFWDNRFINCVWDSCGSATANATAPNVWLRNSAANSAYGFSSDVVNQTYFYGCRWEGFTTGAVRIERGLNNTGQPAGIFFTDCKMETINLNGGNHLFVDTPCQFIDVKHLYCYSGGFHAAYSTAQDVISFSPQVGTLDDVRIFNASASATIANGVTLNSPLSSGTVAAENIRGKYTTAPTGAHINFGGTNTGAYKLSNLSSDNGTQYAGTIPSTMVANQTLNLVNGSVSDGSFNTTPIDGTLAVDTLNKRLWTRYSSGTWARIPLNTCAASITSTTTIAGTGALSTLQAANIAANEPQSGSIYVIRGYGTYSVNAATTPTLAFTAFWGTTAGTAIASIPLITASSGISTASFSYEIYVTFRSTTSLTTALTVEVVTNTTTGALSRFVGVPSTATTVTTTGANTLTMGFQWGTSNANNTISLLGGLSSKIN